VVDQEPDLMPSDIIGTAVIEKDGGTGKRPAGQARQSRRRIAGSSGV
jgi:hypothetical protein